MDKKEYIKKRHSKKVPQSIQEVYKGHLKAQGQYLTTLRLPSIYHGSCQSLMAPESFRKDTPIKTFEGQKWKT